MSNPRKVEVFFKLYYFLLYLMKISSLPFPYVKLHFALDVLFGWHTAVLMLWEGRVWPSSLELWGRGKEVLGSGWRWVPGVGTPGVGRPGWGRLGWKCLASVHSLRALNIWLSNFWCSTHS